MSAALPLIRARNELLTLSALRSVFKDQEADVVVAGRPLDLEWDARLARTIYTRNRNTAADVGAQVAKRLPGDFDPDVMDAWLTKNADVAAASINDATRYALDRTDEKQAVFATLLTVGAARFAASMVTTAANFGAHDAARTAGGRTKTWVSSGSPRHAAMSGETVPLADSFSNGMAWPGDPDGGAEEVANCRCTVTFQ